MSTYTYLTPLKPSSPGAIPELGILEIKEFKKRTPVDFMANGFKHRRKIRGILTYSRKLSLPEQFKYSLVETSEILERTV